MISKRKGRKQRKKRWREGSREKEGEEERRKEGRKGEEKKLAGYYDQILPDRCSYQFTTHSTTTAFLTDWSYFISSYLISSQLDKTGYIKIRFKSSCNYHWNAIILNLSWANLSIIFICNYQLLQSLFIFLFFHYISLLLSFFLTIFLSFFLSYFLSLCLLPHFSNSLPFPPSHNSCVFLVCFWTDLDVPSGLLSWMDKQCSLKEVLSARWLSI